MNAYKAITAVAMVFAWLGAGLTLRATPQQPAPLPLPDVQTLGPQVGSKVPDFTLVDQNGQARSLTSLTGPKGLMLVFYRSADWCPNCKTQLAEIQSRAASLTKSGIGLAAVSYDPSARPRRLLEATRHHVSAAVGSGFGDDQALRHPEYDRA